MKKAIVPIICFAILILFTFSASATGDSIETATNVYFDVTYTDSITETQREDYYRFTLSESGRISIKFTSFMEYYSATIYNTEGVELWYTETNQWISTTGKRTDTYSIDLEKGTYFMKVNGCCWHNDYEGTTGNYNFIISFHASGANIAEPNNNISEAKVVELSKLINGQIAKNDKEDYYKFTLSASGRISFKFTSFLEYYSITLYNTEGIELWYTESNQWISTTGKRTDTHFIDLEKGTYYVKVNGCYWHNDVDGSTGNYNFTINFTASGANVSEPNNNIAEAKSIKLSTVVKGQIAINDREDYYRFTLGATEKLSLKFNSFMMCYSATIYDTEGTEVWYTEYNEWNSTTGKRTDTHQIDLNRGTYFIKINGCRWHNDVKDSTGNYNFTIGINVSVPTPTSLKASAIKSTVLKLSWPTVNGATGYIVYRYDPATNKYTKIGATTKTVFAVKKLLAGTTYHFAVKAYKSVNGTNYYSEYSDVFTTNTKPSTPSVKVTTGNKKAVLKWNAVKGANTYLVYRATSANGKYKKIGTVTDTRYISRNLSAGRTYYYKVVAVANAGNTAIRSNASSIVAATIK